MRYFYLWLICLFWLVSCSSMRVTTTTTRTATEQILISSAIQRSVKGLDLDFLKGSKVFVNSDYLTVGENEKPFLVGAIQGHLLRSGCLIMQTREESNAVISFRNGGIGVDNYDLKVCVPGFSYNRVSNDYSTPPTVLPTVQQVGSITTPEFSVYRNCTQVAIASLFYTVYASNPVFYHAGESVGQAVRSDFWILGLGPLTNTNVLGLRN